MNRIILIGNGFDLAHDLKTSYANFIDWYWDEWGKRLLRSPKKCEEDEFFSFSLSKKTTIEKWNEVAEWYFHDFMIPAHDFIEKILRDSSLCSIDSKSELFLKICQLKETKWVDIENEYYELLSSKNVDPKKLNNDLDIIRKKLIEYLAIIQKGIDEGLIKEDLKKVMFEPLNLRDMSLGSNERWKQWVLHVRFDYSSNEWEQMREDYCIDEKNPEYMKILDDFQSRERIFLAHDLEEKRKEFKRKLNNDLVSKLYCLPDRIMLLNFNYLTTVDMYFGDKKNRFEVNHIHGIISDPNSVIFGYGDELDENYKRLSERNDNEYLRNIKSIKYLEATNSDAYHIYIMGHSCGNSDRTLLNTLFEHKNCVSIKPFYYKRKDGTDNYMELIQNISRNFTDMKLMRDRVVNKTYCETYCDLSVVTS